MRPINDIKTKVLAVVLTIVALLTGQNAWAQTFSVTSSTSGTTTTFTITRTGDSLPAQTVRYRTVNLSAFEGQHFTAVSGELNFDADETSKTVTVTERTPSNWRFQYAASPSTSISRAYRFEVLDFNGFLLAYRNKDVSSQAVKTNATSGSFDLGNERTGILCPSTTLLVITDDGYGKNPTDPAYEGHRYLSLASTDYYDVSTQGYLVANDVQLRMTLQFSAAEAQDGYQYIQILTDNTSTFDSGEKDGDPGTINVSRYMAGFEIYHGSTYDEYQTYTFPVLSADNNAGATNPWGYGDKFNLIKQKFNTDCRATDGKILLNTDFNTLVLRLDASGSGADNWEICEIYGKITAVDENRPYALNSNITVSAGPYNKGNDFYISVPFSEIVVGTPTLITSWGYATYVAGSGSNVLTFKGTITADAGTALSVTGYSGTAPKDLMRNTLTGDISKTFTDIISGEDPYRYYTITYVDAVHGQNNVINRNPTSYNIETPDFQITASNITRLGYNLEGLYSDAEHTQRVNLPVTITRGSATILKDITYYAVWTEAWPGGGEGTEESPYMITTPEHLLAIAQRTNYFGSNSETFSGKYFKLGNSIDMQGIAYDGIAYYPSMSFSGVFDGDGYTISNVTISNDKTHVGVFGRVAGGTIKNLVIDNASITTTGSGNDAGVVVGHLREGGTVSNCVVRNSSVSGYDAGTLVGTINNGNISGNLIFDCSVSGSRQGQAMCGYYMGTNTRVNNQTRNVTVNGDVWSGSLFIIAPDADVTLPVRTGGTVIGHSGITTYSNGATVGTTEYYVQNTTVSPTYSGTVPEGYTFGGFSVKDADGNDVAVTENSGVYTFTMPASDVTVCAVLTANVITGDVNDDGEVTIEDVQALVALILSGSTDYQLSVVDVNGDGRLSIADVTALVNIVRVPTAGTE